MSNKGQFFRKSFLMFGQVNFFTFIPATGGAVALAALFIAVLSFPSVKIRGGLRRVSQARPL
ncbi:hypothetical protein [Acutalibacter caecimuris]|uniref:hypothetical protein n=1 Tax=Acutalibacter caecimuris TaxID=3093657 RepID=UPI002AC8AE69|nr:hypothetical protein [Acutalibacter sp. M00118]